MSTQGQHQQIPGEGQQSTLGRQPQQRTPPGTTRQAQTGMGQQPRSGMQAPPGRQSLALEPVTLQDVIQEEVVTADPDTPVRTIAAEMRENDVGSVVVTDDNEPVGVVTDRSVALQLEQTPDLAQQEVQSVVDGGVTTGTPSMTIFEALQVMNDEDVRRLPVVDEEGELRGIITLDDVLVLLGTELGNAAEIIKAQSPRL